MEDCTPRLWYSKYYTPEPYPEYLCIFACPLRAVMIHPRHLHRATLSCYHAWTWLNVLHRYVYFTSGSAVISLPSSNDTAKVKGGHDGLILATDIASVSRLGHVTTYGKKERTVGVAIGLANNTVPKHAVLHSGPCSKNEKIKV